MSMTVSVRVAHLSPGKAKGQRYHDTRKRTPTYVEADRSHLNSEIITPPMEAELRKQCEERRAQRSTKRAMRADAAIMTSGIITFGKDAQPVIEAMSREEQDALFARTAKAIANRWKTDVVSLTVHRDESAIHAHFGLLAVDREGKPLAKTLDTRRIQDIAGEIYQPYGITRGTPKAERLARGEDKAQTIHRSVAELHRDLPAEAATKRQEIEAQEREAHARIEVLECELREQETKAEKNRRLIEEQTAKLEAGRVDEEKAGKRIETYERRESEARTRAEALTAQIETDKETARQLQGYIETAKQKADAIDEIIQTYSPKATALEGKVADLETKAADLDAKVQEAAKEPDKRPIKPPEPQMVEVVTSKGLLVTKTERMKMVPVDQVQQYSEQVERRQTRLIGAVVQSQSETRQEREAHEQTSRQSDARARLLNAIAHSPLADKVAEVVPPFRKWLDQIRERDAREQQRQTQQRARGPER